MWWNGNTTFSLFYLFVGIYGLNFLLKLHNQKIKLYLFILKTVVNRDEWTVEKNSMTANKKNFAIQSAN
jgi:hypothetical protein